MKHNSHLAYLRQKKLFLRPSLICFICLSSVFFSDLNKKKMASFILFICQNQNITIFILKTNQKSASLVFDEIKNKKVASSVFWEIKIKTCLFCFCRYTGMPSTMRIITACLICFSKKWPEKHLFIFF